jgi:hypothetical protein
VADRKWRLGDVLSLGDVPVPPAPGPTPPTRPRPPGPGG